ncbi:class I SAM-dependent methyltransferase [Providencia burhodogranariea]|uniref:Methyltransferase n=1 Tax=Providencia burhodogranariea DSM 19968 TaxID=1141662 RepID=K8WSQ0_9GAMM|nr:methyltransferase [Providencia burhodogranariea]EKT62961.1 methyltransferase [Providencia burhodogranariea DSM 19968]
MKISFFYRINHYPLYMKNFISSPKKMGTIIPSSPWLCNKMLNNIDWNNCAKIAEIGAGDGVITKRILKKITPETLLSVYEINDDFIKVLQRIDDHRMEINHRSAEYLSGDYDAIISGIPFRSLDKKTGMRILKKVHGRLIENKGVFILFQYTRGCESMFERYFSFTKERVYLNIPPAWIYTCQPK